MDEEKLTKEQATKTLWEVSKQWNLSKTQDVKMTTEQALRRLYKVRQDHPGTHLSVQAERLTDAIVHKQLDLFSEIMEDNEKSLALPQGWIV